MTSAIPERPTVIDATVFSNLAYHGTSIVFGYWSAR